MKRALSLALIMSILFSAFSLTTQSLIAKKTRRGRQVKVVKLDGSVYKGELIKVDAHSLYLLSFPPRTPINIDINTVNRIYIRKKNRGIQSLLTGFLGGIAIGVIPFAISSSDYSYEEKAIIPFYRGIVWGGTGTLIGLTGLLEPKSKRIVFSNISKTKLAEKIMKLKKYARQK